MSWQLACTAQAPVTDVFAALQPALHKSLIVLEAKQQRSPVITRRSLTMDVPDLDAEDVELVPDVSDRMQSTALRFLHDVVRVACTRLLNASDLRVIQYRIATTLLTQIKSADELRDQLFAVAGRLRSCDLARIDAEKPWLWYHSELLLEAATRARIAGNYEEALLYARAGLALIGLPVDVLLSGVPITVPRPEFPEDTDAYPGSCLEPVFRFIRRSDSLPRQLLIELGQCKRLCGRYESAKRVLEIVLGLSEGPLERAEVYVYLLLLLFTSGHILESVEVGVSCLSELGVSGDLLRNMSQADAEAYIDSVLTKLDDIRKASDFTSYFSALPYVGDDPTIMRRHHILVEISTPAFFVKPYLQSYYIAIMIDDALQHGVTRCLALALSQFTRTAVMRDRKDMMFELMNAARDLATRVPNCRHRGRVSELGPHTVSSCDE